MSRIRVVAASPRQVVASIRAPRRRAALALGAVLLALLGCTNPSAPRAAMTASTSTTIAATPLGSRTVPPRRARPPGRSLSGGIRRAARRRSGRRRACVA